MNAKEQERIDRSEKLRSGLADLDDEAFKVRFRGLYHQVVELVVELVCVHIMPSIERLVLLRMGIDSATMYTVVENVLNAGLLGKGAEYVVSHLSGRDGIDIWVIVATVADDPATMAGLLEGK